MLFICKLMLTAIVFYTDESSCKLTSCDTLCRAAAHSDCCLFPPYTNIFTYLLCQYKQPMDSDVQLTAGRLCKPSGWLRSTVEERRLFPGELSLSCA